MNKIPIKEWFVLSKNERRGVTVLIAILLVVSIFRFLIPVLFDAPEITAEENLLKMQQIKLQYDSLEKEDEGISKQRFSTAKGYTKKNYKKADSEINRLKQDSAKFFDPNLICVEDMVNMGFSQKLASTIDNYRKKGGKFRRTDDLLKIYGFDSLFFDQIKFYVAIERTNSTKTNQSLPIIEINQADTTEFKTLPGIGSAFSKRICNYRKKLGGFYSVEQLKEVYGLPPETFEKIKPMLKVDTLLVKKIDLNFSDYAELAAHPYLDKNDVKKILKARNERGPFRAKYDLLEFSLLDSAKYSRVHPYLKP